MGNKLEYYLTIFLLVLMVPLSIYALINSGNELTDNQNNHVQNQETSKDKEEGAKNGGNKDAKKSKEKAKNNIHWGVDSANITTEELYACVAEEFGKPAVWGRYLGTNEDVSAGLTKDEMEFLHSKDIKILLVYNHFSDATGYDNGKEHAKQAISLAKDLKVPKGKVIFADIEPTYPVDEKFIKGWFDEMNESDYHPGVYGVFEEELDLYKVYSQLNEKIKDEMIIWSAFPQKGITSKDTVPEFAGHAPKGTSLLGWQYGIDAKACTIDTNLFKDKLMKYLW